MYFKRLDIVGFKSFGSKTVINFEPGITAIVGPNGCGKSNILDAIRWVLGEQSPKSLRGDGMIDVIFSGTSESKALGMAEVILTISDVKEALDIDYDEISIGRRLFRSGESQYLINRKPCRLKDIVELFMNTGVGLDAYSFIEQGKIDLILSNKPEDRRYLFEEAAGITKYKSDKKVALRRLQNTEDNLARVNDIISEVKRQINSLGRQASKARKFKATAQELAQLEVGFLLYRRAICERDLLGIREEQDTIKSAIESFSGDITVEEEAIQELRVEMKGCEQKYESLQTQKLNLLRQLDRHENTVNLCEQRINDIEAARTSNLQQIAVLGDQISNAEQELEQRENELDTLTGQHEELSGELSTREEEFRIMKVNLETDEQQTRDINRQIMTLTEQTISLKNRISGLDEQRESIQNRIQRIEQKRAESQSRLTELQTQEQQAQANKEQIEQTITELKQKQETLQTHRAGINDQLHALRGQVMEAQKRYSEASSQLNLLKEMKQRYEGYDAGVKSLLTEAGNGSGQIKGLTRTVAEGLKVKAGYETAIETVLAGFVQCVVFDSQANLNQAATWLKQQKRGKASLTVTQAMTAEAGAASTAGMLSAYDCLEPGSEAPAYLMSMLKNTLVLDDLDAALQQVQQGCTSNLVTKTGDSVYGGEIVTAGSAVDSNTSLIMRDKRINELEQEVQVLADEITKLEQQQGALTDEITAAEEQLKSLADQVTEHSKRFAEANQAHMKLGATVESLQNELTRDTSDIDQATLEYTQMGERKQRFAVELEQASAQKDQLQQQHDEAVLCLRERTELVSDTQQEVMEMRVRTISVSEKVTGLNHRIDQVQRDLVERQKQLAQRKNDVEQSAVQKEEFARQIEENNKEIETKTEQQTGLDHDLEKIDAERMEIFNAISEKEEIVRDRRGRLSTIHEKENDINVKIAEFGFTIKNIDDSLLKDYNLTHDDPKAERLPDDTDWDQVEMQLTELRRQKESMGSVNLYAIEEQERLQERYNFLLEQQADLDEAKDDLLKALAKINTTTKKLFKETFDIVRDEFRGMFKRLFNGGRADLILVDESDILECGIEIIASPPGKKLQNITLLSGGEKAMTAISLMLSLFSVKPSPFCVLDEVDAPLDESNIGRFLDVIKDFTSKTQFMVVTHNKRTISMSDVLYGITMEESGKSKVVSVKFKDKTNIPKPTLHPLAAR